MKIKATIERVPGGMMIIPLFLGAALNTFAPGTADFFGGFTGALITGTLPILGVFIFCVGATIDFRSSGYIARKGITLLLGKVGFAALLGVIAAQFIPDEGIQSGFFAGLSVLAIVAVMNETNGGLYLALMNHMGRKRGCWRFRVYQYRIRTFYDHGDVWCDGTCRISVGNAGSDSHSVFTRLYTWKS